MTSQTCVTMRSALDSKDDYDVAQSPVKKNDLAEGSSSIGGQIFHRPGGSVLLVSASALDDDQLVKKVIKTCDATEAIGGNASKGGNANSNNNCNADRLSVERSPTLFAILDTSEQLPTCVKEHADAEKKKTTVRRFRVHPLRYDGDSPHENVDNHEADSSQNAICSFFMCIPCSLKFSSVTCLTEHASRDHKIERSGIERKDLESDEISVILQEDSSGRVFVSVLEYLGELSTDEYVTCDPVAMEAMPETTANANEVRGCSASFEKPVFAVTADNDDCTTLSAVASSKNVTDLKNRSLTEDRSPSDESHVALDLSKAPSAVSTQDSSTAAMSFALTSPMQFATSLPTSHPSMVVRSMSTVDSDMSDTHGISAKDFSPTSRRDSMQSTLTPQVSLSSVDEEPSRKLLKEERSTSDDIAETNPLPTPSETRNQHESPVSAISTPVDPVFPMIFQSRNSCKTLKCPKCNWHYKYRQTLEAHMKEKHMEDTMDCVYCNAGQPHPRLSRGESYSCGYKPFKCNVCNYSTTTKGNLSIHMQSDKHLYNARTLQHRHQERLRNGSDVGTVVPPRQSDSVTSQQNDHHQQNQRMRVRSPESYVGATFEKTTQRRRRSSSRVGESSVTSSGGNKWRCDVCGYETAIARNLRIHNTSEKHQQNVALMERSLKQMSQNKGNQNDKIMDLARNLNATHPPQGLMEYYASALKSLQQNQLTNEVMARLLPGSDDQENARKAQAEYFQQQLLISQQQQILLAQQYQQLLMAAAAASSLQQRLNNMDQDRNPNLLPASNQLQLWKQLLPGVPAGSEGSEDSGGPRNTPSIPSEVTKSRMFSCDICGVFGTDDIATLDMHVRKLRHNEVANESTNSEWVSRMADGYFCRLCKYSTGLKTNFNLHCKTEKHTNKLNLIAHVKEGGACSDWMISHVINGNITQSVACNPCQFVTHSVDKLKQHCASEQHQGVRTVCQFLHSLLESRRDALRREMKVDRLKLRLKCLACSYFSARHVVEMVRHMQTEEHRIQLQRHNNPAMTSLRDVLSVEVEGDDTLSARDEAQVVGQNESDVASKKERSCQFCTYLTDDAEKLRMHTMTQHSAQPPSHCPLCQDLFHDPMQLHLHLVHFHKLAIPRSDELQQEKESPSAGVTKDSRKNSGRPNKDPENAMETENVTVSQMQHEPTAKLEKINSASIKGPFQPDATKASRECADDTLPGKNDELATPAKSEGVSRVPEAGCDLTNNELGAASQTHVRDMKEKTNDGQAGNASPSDSSKDAVLPTRLQAQETENILSPEPLALAVATSRSCPNIAAVCNESSPPPSSSETAKFIEASKPKRTRIRSCPVVDGSRSRACEDLLSRYGLEQALHYVENRSSENRTKARSWKGDRDAKPSHSSNPTPETESLESDEPKLEVPQPANSAVHNAGSEKMNEKQDLAVEEKNVQDGGDADLACRHCGKEFTGLWILKAHEEVMHGVCVPTQKIQKVASVYSDKLRDKVIDKPSADGLPKNSPETLPRRGIEPDLQQSSSESPVRDEPMESNDLPQQYQQQLLIKALLNAQSNMPDVQKNFVDNQLYLNNPLQPNMFSQMNLYSALLQAQSQSLGLSPFQLLANAAAVQQMQQVNLAGGVLPMQHSEPNFPVSKLFPSLAPQVLGVTPNVDRFLQKDAPGHATPTPQSHAVAMDMPVKRPRTRITDEQLKVLRANFDINNSPSEDQIDQMASLTALPPKVIKHWFRNTLFKERQRSKDSPYNFNIPPTTSLDDVYKKSPDSRRAEGEPVKVKKEAVLGESEETANVTGKENRISPVIVSPVCSRIPQDVTRSVFTGEYHSSSSPVVQPKSEPSQRLSTPISNIHSALFSGSSSLSGGRSVGRLLSQDGAKPNNDNEFVSSATSLPSLTYGVQQSTLDGSARDAYFSENSSSDGTSFMTSQSASCRRTPRTRFTDYQLQVLQEFFDRNAYPKDDDLDKLSQCLNLSTRVIVVWFQNARQKARKTLEQQQQQQSQQETAYAEPAGRTSSPATADAITKARMLTQTDAPAVEDLARRALTEVSKAITRRGESKTEEEEKQEAGFPCQMCDATFTSAELWQKHHQAHLAANMASVFGQYGMMYMQNLIGNTSQVGEKQLGTTEKQQVSFQKDDNGFANTGDAAPLWETATNWNAPGDFSKTVFQNNKSPTSLSTMANQSMNIASKRKISSSPTSSSSSQNSGYRSKGSSLDDKESQGAQKDPKRLRTTITPEQLEFLYKQYLIDSSPSRKIIEQISEVVGLKKRVVQVWFQNTRARERKGQFRSSVARCVSGQMVQHKYCQLCRMLFRSKVELDAHIQNKHADQAAEQADSSINVSPPEKKAKLSVKGSLLPASDATKQENKTNFSKVQDNSMAVKLLNASRLDGMSPVATSDAGPKDVNTSFSPRLSTESLSSASRKNSVISRHSTTEAPKHLPTLFPQNLTEKEPAAQKPHPRMQAAMTSGGSSSVIKAAANGAAGHRPSHSILDLGSCVDRACSEEAARSLSSIPMSPAANSVDASVHSTAITDSLPFVRTGYPDVSFASVAKQPALSSANVVPGSPPLNRDSANGAAKRFRTQMSATQVKALKSCYRYCKTPTLNECESVGLEVGLAKRVVQVWFQNARAKEKKRQSKEGGVPDSETHEERYVEGCGNECDVCFPAVRFTSEQNAREHRFSREHLQQLMKTLEFESSTGFAHNSPASSCDSSDASNQGDACYNVSPRRRSSSPSTSDALVNGHVTFTLGRVGGGSFGGENGRTSPRRSCVDSGVQVEEKNKNEAPATSISQSSSVTSSPLALQQYQQALQQFIAAQHQMAQDSASEHTEPDEERKLKQNLLQQALQKSMYQMLQSSSAESH